MIFLFQTQPSGKSQKKKNEQTNKPFEVYLNKPFSNMFEVPRIEMYGCVLYGSMIQFPITVTEL